jgi:hypothetical protein
MLRGLRTRAGALVHGDDGRVDQEGKGCGAGVDEVGADDCGAACGPQGESTPGDTVPGMDLADSSGSGAW